MQMYKVHRILLTMLSQGVPLQIQAMQPLRPQWTSSSNASMLRPLCPPSPCTATKHSVAQGDAVTRDALAGGDAKAGNDDDAQAVIQDAQPFAHDTQEAIKGVVTHDAH